jgi:hypothetical protein
VPPPPRTGPPRTGRGHAAPHAARPAGTAAASPAGSAATPLPRWRRAASCESISVARASATHTHHSDPRLEPSASETSEYVHTLASTLSRVTATLYSLCLSPVSRFSPSWIAVHALAIVVSCLADLSLSVSLLHLLSLAHMQRLSKVVSHAPCAPISYALGSELQALCTATTAAARSVWLRHPRCRVSRPHELASQCCLARRIERVAAVVRAQLRHTSL